MKPSFCIGQRHVLYSLSYNWTHFPPLLSSEFSHILKHSPLTNEPSIHSHLSPSTWPLGMMHLHFALALFSLTHFSFFPQPEFNGEVKSHSSLHFLSMLYLPSWHWIQVTSPGKTDFQNKFQNDYRLHPFVRISRNL